MSNKQQIKPGLRSSDSSSDKPDKVPVGESTRFSSLSLDEKLLIIFNEIRGVKEEQKSIIQSIEDIQISVDGFRKNLKSHDDKLAKHSELFSALNAEIDYLKSENQKLKSEMNDSKQYSRKNSVEISGLPLNKSGDNLSTVLNKLFTFLKFNFTSDMVDIMHPLPSRTDSNGRSAIIKFVKRTDTLALLELAKKNRGLKASDVGLQSQNSIFINPSLSKENKQLFKDARLLKKSHGIKYVWVHNCKILVRRSDDDRVYPINSREDLDNLKKKYDPELRRNIAQ